MKPIHRDLLELFKAEMEYREDPGELNDFEQLCWSALLLYLVRLILLVLVRCGPSLG